MLILRSFFESVFLFVKSLAVKVTKQMYRSSSDRHRSYGGSRDLFFSQWIWRQR